MDATDQPKEGACGGEGELTQAERLRRALQSLSETMSDIVAAVEEKKGERCPYRNAQDECTFRGGCQNKRRRPGAPPLCGGDKLIRWE